VIVEGVAVRKKTIRRSQAHPKAGSTTWKCLSTSPMSWRKNAIAPNATPNKTESARSLP
jgi:hypothetical protein